MEGPPSYVLRLFFSAVFGKRAPLLESFARWLREAAVSSAGLELDRCAFALGFIGISHSTAVFDCNFESSARASAFLSQLNAHDTDLWTKTTERDWLVPGSRRWELLRCVDGDAPQGKSGLVVQWSMTASPGRVSELVAHIAPAVGAVLNDVGCGGARRRVLVGDLGLPQDAVTVEMDLANIDQLKVLLDYMESGAAAQFIGAIADEAFVVAGSQNWTVLRKLTA